MKEPDISVHQPGLSVNFGTARRLPRSFFVRSRKLESENFLWYDTHAF